MTSTVVENEFDYLTGLTEEDLRAAADYFGTKKGLRGVMMKELRESGVTKEQYDIVFAPQTEAPVEDVVEIPVVAPISDTELDEVYASEPEPLPVRVAEPKVFQPADYLIRMDRQNLRFEFGKYVFTAEYPYQIMPAADAQRILSEEDGFRQAFPDEAREYFSG